MSRVWLDVYADERDAEAVVRLLQRGKANQAGDDDPIPSLDWGRSWENADDEETGVPPGGPNAEPTAYEETRARQTGATVEQLRKETRSGATSRVFRVELERKLNVCAYAALEVEARNEAEAKALALVRAQDGVTQVQWEPDFDEWWDDTPSEGDITALPDVEEVAQCGSCGNPLDDALGKALGCFECDLQFCSGECYDKHVAESGHDS